MSFVSQKTMPRASGFLGKHVYIGLPASLQNSYFRFSRKACLQTLIADKYGSLTFMSWPSCLFRKTRCSIDPAQIETAIRSNGDSKKSISSFKCCFVTQENREKGKEKNHDNNIAELFLSWGSV